MGSPIRQRLKERRFTRCSVDGCPRYVHKLSSMCSKHGAKVRDHGAPDARAIRVSELEPYAKVFRKFVRANLTHPAVALVISELDTMIADGVAKAAVTPLPARKRNTRDTGEDWPIKLAHEMARLRDERVTARDVLVAVGSVWFYSRDNQNVLPPMSVQHHFATARAVLGLAGRPRCVRSWSDSPVPGTRRYSAPVLRHLGPQLLTMLCGVLRSAEAAFDARANQLAERRRNLAAALEQPFN